MKWDRLLEWMSHLGSGTWEMFRGTVDGLADEDDNDANRHLLHRNLRIAFSDLGHADFHIGGSRRWRSRRPALVGLSDGENEHLFTGGRSASLASELTASARDAKAVVTSVQEFPQLSRVQVTGEPDRLARLAQDLGIDYLKNGATTLAARLSPLQRTFEACAEADEPIGWNVRSWSFAHAQWVARRLHRSLREYSNRHGARRYFVDTGRRKPLHEVERRAGMYYAARTTRIRLITYSHSDRTLQVPRWAPLPTEHARIACLAGGRLATLTERYIVFHGIDYRIASIMLASLGQGVPMPGISK